jgi:hypothetical protein
MILIRVQLSRRRGRSEIEGLSGGLRRVMARRHDACSVSVGCTRESNEHGRRREGEDFTCHRIVSLMVAPIR